MGKGNDLAGANRARKGLYVSDDLWNRYGEYCEENNTNRSEDLRRYMARCIGETEESKTDERLSQALSVLRTVADPSGRVPGRVAKREIAQTVGIPKTEVGRAVLDPLNRMGYIDVPTIGTIRVREDESD